MPPPRRLAALACALAAAAARPAGDPSSANDTAASSAEGAHAAVLQPKADPFAGLPPFHAAVSTLLADSGTGAPPAIAIDSPAAVALKSINVSVALPPFPPSPPSEPPFPPPSPPEVWGKDVGLKITKTSDPRQDASLLARIAAVRMLQQTIVPVAVVVIVLLLFLLDGGVYLATPLFSRSQLTQRTQNVLRIALCTASFMVRAQPSPRSASHPTRHPAASHAPPSPHLSLQVCSASSAIFNKLSLFTMPLPSTLLVLQFALAIVILGLWNLATVCILGRKAIGITWGSRRDLTRWLPVAVLSVASMWTFLYALEAATLSAVVTWRNLAPMPTVRRRTDPAAAAPRRRAAHRRRAAPFGAPPAPPPTPHHPSPLFRCLWSAAASRSFGTARRSAPPPPSRSSPPA